MISKGVYLFTLLRIARSNVLYFLAFSFVFLMPVLGALAEQVPASSTTDNFLAHSYPCSILFGLSLAVSVSVVNSASAQSGKSDYLPLLLTRPLKRSTYILTKWLALVTAIGAVSLLQLIVIVLVSPFKMPPELFGACLVERILDVLSVSGVLVLVLSLPTRNMNAYGILVLELLAGWAMFAQISYVLPGFKSGDDTIARVANLFGVNQWLYAHMVAPLLPWDQSSAPLYSAVGSAIMSFVGPRTFAYELLNAQPLNPLPWITFALDLLVSLVVATIILDHRDVNYASE